MLVPLRREQHVVAAALAASALVSLGVVRPSVGALILFAVVAMGYAALRYRRSPVFTGGAPLGDPTELEAPGHLMLRVSILVAPPVALLILLALVDLGVATAVVAGLVAGYAVGALGGGGIRRMERRYAVVLTRRCPRSLRPGRYAFDPVVVPLDEARVDQLIRDGIAVPSSSASPGR